MGRSWDRACLEASIAAGEEGARRAHPARHKGAARTREAVGAGTGSIGEERWHTVLCHRCCVTMALHIGPACSGRPYAPSSALHGLWAPPYAPIRSWSQSKHPPARHLGLPNSGGLLGCQAPLAGLAASAANARDGLPAAKGCKPSAAAAATEPRLPRVLLVAGKARALGSTRSSSSSGVRRMLAPPMPGARTGCRYYSM